MSGGGPRRLRKGQQVWSHRRIGQVVQIQGSGEEVDSTAMRPDGAASLDIADGPDIQAGQRRKLFLGQPGGNPEPAN